MNIQIFDFDGVICDSNNIKTKCLKKAVEININKSAAEDFEKHHKLNGGISRYEKYKRIIKRFECNNQIYKKMISDAENLLKIEFENLTIIDNTEKVLKKFFDKNDKLFIASGGNQEEIIFLCKKWDIYKYFNGIYGSPKKKIDISKNIKSAYKNEKIFFYGDSKYDYECSQVINSNFVFVSGFSEFRNWYKPEMGREIISLEQLITD